MADEVIERYTKLADQFGARVEATPDDAWDKPAPCEGWKARDVLTHVTDSQRNLTAALTGSEPGPAADDPKSLWRETYAAFKDAINQPGALDKNVPGPFGEMPAQMVIGRFLATDALVHTWDLARAVGGDERIDADAVTQAYSGLKPMDAMIRQPGVFGPKVDSAADADEQEQFLNFLGRVTRP
jgi:uncharacterized protein (TIGR03086 family)